MFVAVSVFTVSCNSNIPVTPQIATVTIAVEAPSATPSSFPESAQTDDIIPTPIIEPTFTPQSNNEPGLIVTLEGGGYADIGIPIFSPNGKIVVLAGGGVIRLWDANSHEMLRDMNNPYAGRCFIRNAQFSPDSNLFTVILQNCDFDFSKDSTGHLLVWDTNTGDLLQDEMQEPAKISATLESGEATSTSFCSGGREFYNADGDLMACARIVDNKQAIELWNTQNQQVIYTFIPDFEKDWLYSLYGIAFSPDNTILAIAHNDQISLWNLRPVVQP